MSRHARQARSQNVLFTDLREVLSAREPAPRQGAAGMQENSSQKVVRTGAAWLSSYELRTGIWESMSKDEPPAQVILVDLFLVDTGLLSVLLSPQGARGLQHALGLALEQIANQSGE